MTFYKYFPSKEKLIESCLYKRNSDIQSAILERINTNDLPLVQLRSLFNGILTGFIQKTLMDAYLKRQLWK